MFGPESKAARIINGAGHFLGLERGRARWEYLGSGFRIGALAEIGLMAFDFLTENPLFGFHAATSGVGLMFAGDAIDDRLARSSRIAIPTRNKIISTVSGLGNLIGTALMRSGNHELYLFSLSLTTVSAMVSAINWTSEHEFVINRILHQAKSGNPIN